MGCTVIPSTKNLVCISILALNIGLGCKTPNRHASSSETTTLIDEPLLAYLSTVRSLHHQADLAEDTQDFQSAIQALEQILTKPRPRSANEINEVLADTYSRLGDLRSRIGLFEAAHRDVDQGLRFTSAHTYFSGHLFEIRGLIDERFSKKLMEQGRSDEAAHVRQRAMKAYEQAVAEQDSVIQRHIQSKTIQSTSLTNH